jgi:hypothetical protein
MLAVTFLLPAVFGLVLWLSYRTNRRREADGGGFRPEGKIRWSDDGAPGSRP